MTCRIWMMQGETLLENVYTPQAPHTMGVEWFDGMPGEPASFADYRHLNARVTPGQSAAWKVSLPEELLSAELSSAIGIGEHGAESSFQAPVTFEAYLAVEGGTQVLVFQREVLSTRGGWTELNIDLTEYRGMLLVVTLAVRGGDDLVYALYRFPTIDLNMLPESSMEAAPQAKPINAGLADESPHTTPQDYQFNQGAAQLNGLSAVKGAANNWQVQADPHVLILLEKPISLDEYGWIAFKLAASPDIPSRGAEVRTYFEGRDELLSIVIPLMKDGASYFYTYPHWMVDIPGRLSALRLDPVQVPAARGESIVTIDEIRLISINIR